MVYRGNRAAVAEMARDQLELIAAGIVQSPKAVGNVAMRNAMEPVAPDLVPRVVDIGNAIKERTRRNRLVECRVEYRDIRRVGRQLAARVNAFQIRGVV